MKYELTATEHGKLDEAGRKLYKAEGDGFRLIVEGLPKPDDKAVKAALVKERENLAAAQKKMKAFEALGLTADEIKTLVTKSDDAATEKAKAEGDYESLIAGARKKWDVEKEVLVKERDAALSGQKKSVIDLSLTAALVEAGFTKAGLELITPRLAPRIDIKDGVTSILTADLKGPMAGASSDARATFAELAAEAVESFPELVASDRVGGGGKPPAGGGKPGAGKKTMKRAAFDALDPTTKKSTMAEGLVVVD